MRFGTSYYPELTPPEEWDVDLQRMASAGMTLLRIGEFAWSSLEPREGCYQFEWLDRFLAMASERGFEVILCTPTATPPPWMTSQYPAMLIVERGGRRRHWGGRRDVDVDEPVYRFFSRQIAEVLGRRYGQHPAIIGWQIDNELIGPEGVAPEVHTQAAQFEFRQYLKAVHGDLETLNRRCGTDFWSQRYSDWGEITTPISPRSSMGQVLDYSRYFSRSLTKFAAMQRDALRPHLRAGVWIGHNCTAIFDRGIDHTELSREMDIGGWDAYFGAAGGVHPVSFAALAHDMFRSTHHKPFWVFETGCMGSKMSDAYVAEMRARGAQACIFWHWRNHRANAENNSDTFCDCDGTPIQSRLDRIRALAEDPILSRPLPATFAKRSAAIMFCQDAARVTLTPDPYVRADVGALRVLIETYHVLRRLGIAVDVVRPGESLEGYRLLVLPSARLLDESSCGLIDDFVAKGGTLLSVAKTAHMDSWGKYYAPPGQPLNKVIGADVRRDERLNEPCQITLNGATVDCLPYAERRIPTTAAALATFTTGPLAGVPAGLINDYQQGTVFHACGVSPALIEHLALLAAKRADVWHRTEPDPSMGVLPELAGEGLWEFGPDNWTLTEKPSSPSPNTRLTK